MNINDMSVKNLIQNFCSSDTVFDCSLDFRTERLRNTRRDNNNRGVLRHYYLRDLGSRNLQDQTASEFRTRHRRRAAGDDRYTDCTGCTNAIVFGHELAA